MTAEMPLVTFVVPAYNAQAYLACCLDSLVNQTRTAHKILVIDDGSKDQTGEIAESYARRYPALLRCVHQENRGLGAARNAGLALVDTPYVTFLDSDDWQDCRFVEKLLTVLQHPAEVPDIVFTLPHIYDAVTHQVLPWRDQPLLEKLFYPDGSADSKVLNVRTGAGLELYALEASACRRVYRRDFLQKIGFHFSEGVKWEDVEPHFRAIHDAQRCIALRQTGFFYRVNTGTQITADSGRARLDVVPVFRSTLAMAEAENWQPQEIGYIMRMLWSFASWSIGLADSRYSGQLLDAMHAFFRKVPGQYFRFYYRWCATSVARDRILIACLRGPFYRLLGDYRTRQKVKRLMEKLVLLKQHLRR